MKSLITSLLAIIFTSGTVFSQCTSTVHTSSIVIKSSGQRNTANRYYWVCDGKSLILTGDRNTIWVDRGGTLSLTGDTNTVYAREGSVITIAENNNEVYIDLKVIQAGDYTDNGTLTTKTNCTPMIFDYSQAPTDGCTFWLGIEGVTVVKEAKVYPSPANDYIKIDFPLEQIESYTVRIYDALGKVVQESRSNQRIEEITINISNLPAGTYTVQVESGNVLINEKFIIQR